MTIMIFDYKKRSLWLFIAYFGTKGRWNNIKNIKSCWHRWTSRIKERSSLGLETLWKIYQSSQYKTRQSLAGYAGMFNVCKILGWQGGDLGATCKSRTFFLDRWGGVSRKYMLHTFGNVRTLRMTSYRITEIRFRNYSVSFVR